MPRPTREVNLPSGAKVNIYTYLTAKDTLELRSIMMSAMKMDINDLKSENIGPGKSVPMKGEINGSILLEQEKALVKALVQSIPGVPIEETATGVADLQATDYDALVKELDIVKSGNLTSAK